MEVWYSGNDLSLTHCCPAFFFQVSAAGTVAVSTGTGTHFNLTALSAMDEIVSEFSGFTADHCMQRFQFKLRDRMGKTVITEVKFQQITDGIIMGGIIRKKRFRNGIRLLFCQVFFRPPANRILRRSFLRRKDFQCVSSPSALHRAEHR